MYKQYSDLGVWNLCTNTMTKKQNTITIQMNYVSRVKGVTKKHILRNIREELEMDLTKEFTKTKLLSWEHQQIKNVRLVKQFGEIKVSRHKKTDRARNISTSDGDHQHY